MLRYIYLLIVLFNLIDLNLCYERFDVVGAHHFRGIADNNSGKFRGKRKNNARKNEDTPGFRVRKSHYLLPEGRETFSQFDVANFIKNPVVSGNEDAPIYKYDRRRRTKDYDYGGLVNLGSDSDASKKDSFQDYTNLGTDNAADLNANPQSLKSTKNTKRLNLNGLSLSGEKIALRREDMPAKNSNSDESPVEKSPVHSAAKKSSKQLRIPFFSHGKTSTKSKKTKKNKLENPANVEYSPNDVNTDLNGIEDTKLYASNPLNNKSYRINKRSYIEMLCPVCKKKFPYYDGGKRQATNRFVHNSRQYFQRQKEQNNDSEALDLNTENIIQRQDKNIDNDSFYRRKKRDDKDRQIKEIEEVQKKVESVDVNYATVKKND